MTGPALPLVTAALTMLFATWLWGGLRAPAVVDDEAAYLLQAGLLVRGHWSLPTPAVPEAFTQNAVLMAPVVAPKMSPGHAIVLAPGVALGVPGLIPIMLLGATAAMLIVLARRLASPAVAVLTWTLWMIQGGQWRWRASYFSELTTGLLWLVGWWALLEWRESRKGGWLALVGLCAGWGAITRPLTMLVWAVPVAVVVLPEVWRRRAWLPVGGAIAAGAICLVLMPVQNAEILGDWRRSPLTLYREQYLPFDHLGFGFDSTRASIGLPPFMDAAHDALRQRHREHVPTALPGILQARLGALASQTVGQWRLALVPVLLAGVVVSGVPGAVGVATLLLLYGAYLLYAHEPYWTIYYFEAMPVPAFVLALGFALIVRTVQRHRDVALKTVAPIVVALLLVWWPDAMSAHSLQVARQEPYRAVERAVAATGVAQALVFVHYAADRDLHANIVRYPADPATAAMLTAHDLGDSTTQAIASHYPGRIAMRWDAASQQLTRIPMTTP